MPFYRILKLRGVTGGGGAQRISGQCYVLVEGTVGQMPEPLGSVTPLKLTPWHVVPLASCWSILPEFGALEIYHFHPETI